MGHREPSTHHAEKEPTEAMLIPKVEGERPLTQIIMGKLIKPNFQSHVHGTSASKTEF